jgi:hypothetical protein
MELSELQSEMETLHQRGADADDDDRPYEEEDLLGAPAVHLAGYRLAKLENSRDVVERRDLDASLSDSEYEEAVRERIGQMLVAVADTAIKHDVDLERALVEELQHVRSQVQLYEDSANGVGEVPGETDTDLDADEDRTFQ